MDGPTKIGSEGWRDLRQGSAAEVREGEGHSPRGGGGGRRIVQALGLLGNNIGVLDLYSR